MVLTMQEKTKLPIQNLVDENVDDTPLVKNTANTDIEEKSYSSLTSLFLCFTSELPKIFALTAAAHLVANITLPVAFVGATIVPYLFAPLASVAGILALPFISAGLPLAIAIGLIPMETIFYGLGCIVGSYFAGKASHAVLETILNPKGIYKKEAAELDQKINDELAAEGWGLFQR